MGYAGGTVCTFDSRPSSRIKIRKSSVVAWSLASHGCTLLQHATVVVPSSCCRCRTCRRMEPVCIVHRRLLVRGKGYAVHTGVRSTVGVVYSYTRSNGNPLVLSSFCYDAMTHLRTEYKYQVRSDARRAYHTSTPSTSLLVHTFIPLT